MPNAAAKEMAIKRALRIKGSIPPRMAAVFNLCYVDPEKAKDPSVSPVFAAPEDLAGMPKALVIVCGGDSLHDEGFPPGKARLHIQQNSRRPRSH
jgi:acetyl esterase/lipase